MPLLSRGSRGFDRVRSLLRAVSLAFATLMMVLATVPQAQAISLCMPRYISQNIKDAVLASKAAKYCSDMPYTTTEAMHFVDKMRCSPAASELIDGLLFQHEEDYRTILVKDPNHVACNAAAKIKVSELLKN